MQWPQVAWCPGGRPSTRAGTCSFMESSVAKTAAMSMAEAARFAPERLSIGKQHSASGSAGVDLSRPNAPSFSATLPRRVPGAAGSQDCARSGTSRPAAADALRKRSACSPFVFPFTVPFCTLMRKSDTSPRRTKRFRLAAANAQVTRIFLSRAFSERPTP